jgi:hypothetical protein
MYLDWKLYFQNGWNSINWHDLLCHGGLTAFAVGLVNGFIDEILAHFLVNYPNVLKWIRRIIFGASVAVGM